ncbi:MAG: class I adenylate-forming enzyme family protein [Tepidisphaerales bacterium]
MALLTRILRTALSHPLRTAVVDDRGPRSYPQCLVGAMMLSRLIDRETTRDTVGMLLPTSAATPLAIVGSWLSLKIPVPINFLLGPGEMQHVIRHAGIDTILTVGPMLEFLGAEAGKGDAGRAEARGAGGGMATGGKAGGKAGEKGGEKGWGRPAGVPEGVKLVRLEEVLPTMGKLSSLRWPPRLTEDQTAVLLYTSGTSGMPKGVPLTFGNLMSNVEAGIRRGNFTKRDVFLGVLPQFHSFGLTACSLFPLVLGAKVVYSARFVPKKIIELFRLHRPTVFMAVPSMYGALLSVKEATREDFASLRMAISGGEPLPEAVRREMYDRFGVRLMEGYGLTETSPVVSWSTPDANRDGCVGKVLDNVDVKIVSEDGKVLPPGEAGEIWVSGPNVFHGYYRDPETTASVFAELTPGGRKYFKTGDIGTLSPDGFLAITGRKKEMLIVGGLNVFPRTIEEVLCQHPGVRDAGVVGKVDDLRGEVPVAFVEMKEGAVFDEAELRQFCRERLAQYKVPREIYRVDSLPRTPTGKVLRRKLKEMLVHEAPKKVDA